MERKELEQILTELIENQHVRLLRMAQRVIPRITADDLLQPNDFPQLEEFPAFRYEEGVLEGLRSALSALRAASVTVAAQIPKRGS